MLDLHPASFYRSPAPVLNPPIGSRLRYGISSCGLSHQNLTPFFPECDLIDPIRLRINSNLNGVLAWGTKPSSLSAIGLAKQLSIPLPRIEDGFLYGIEPASARMSLVIDDLGIYYDARFASRLESLIANHLSADQISRAQLVRELWIKHGVSKYNHAPNWIRSNVALRDDRFSSPFILLIDQTRGDQSIAGAFADESSFLMMLDAALTQMAVEHIVIKVHPEVLRGTKLGHFDVSLGSAISRNPRIRVMTDDYCLPSVIKEASAVYTVSSQAGFEALLWGKPVHTFGMPFYAGWGFTSDYLAATDRRCNVSLEQLIYAALISYPRYLHPETNHLCEVEDLIAYLGFQRAMRIRFQQALMPLGFSKNKLRHLKRFTQGAQWIKDNDDPSLGNNSTDGISDRKNGIAVCWGSAHARNKDCTVNFERIQVEDGFIRSIGLGAALATPYSWVFDERGIYYDARSTSDLEHILQNTTFDESLLLRATSLQDQIINLGVSKYNLAQNSSGDRDLVSLKKSREENPTRPLLLVIGQVESDASIQYGGVDIFTNDSLLKTVRENYPNAFIIYKPHPDIAKTVRFSGGNNADHSKIYDLVITDISLSECFRWVDSLHTISSLSGFEALIRGLPVFCYGIPFYAGWGLTIDRHITNRRARKLSIQELIAGSLIIYPSYVHPRSNLYCTPESLVTALYKARMHHTSIFRKLGDVTINTVLHLAMGMINRLKCLSRKS